MVKILCVLSVVLGAGAFGPAALALDAAGDGQAGSQEIARISVERTVAHLGQPGGFYRTPAYHIALPPQLNDAVRLLAKNYASTLPVELERAINRAAEDTAGPAGDYVLKILPSRALPPVNLSGPTDAVTSALRKTIAGEFADALRPIVHAALAKANAGDALERMRVRYESIANAPLPKFDLEAFTVESFGDAFFAGVAQEEQNIRLRPSARSTDLLKALFSDK